MTTVVHSVNIMVFTLVIAVAFVIYAILTYDD